MKIVLFDLDGTLLPMDQDQFIRTYLKELALKGASLGYDAKKLVEIVMGGVEVMVANDGLKTNEERFWEFFIAAFGGQAEDHMGEFERFYRNEFARVASAVTPTPVANQAVQVLKNKGYELVLATNPIFPQVATLARMGWAGLDAGDFALITTYENSRFAKPNLGYYRQILEVIEADPEECLMIGNDVREDIAAVNLGLDVYLVTDDLINVDGEDYSHVRQGDREDLLKYLEDLPTLAGAGSA